MTTDNTLPEPHTSPEIIKFNGVSKVFSLPGSGGRRGRATLRAVNDVTLVVRAGETLALVGESGSGKTTSGRLMLRLDTPTSGRIDFEGQDLATLKGAELRDFRRQVQMVFQDPSQALDSRMTVGKLVQEPLVALGVGHRSERGDRAREALEQVGLGGDRYFDRLPGQLSGGQRQRVAIARALIVEPRLLVCDEPVTALDLSVQAQILNLLLSLQERHGIAMLFIAHDMSVVRQLAHRVAVMYRGELVEMARAEEFFESPAHPYSHALLNATLSGLAVESSGHAKRLGRESEVPSRGCVLAHRCWKAGEKCETEAPPMYKVSPLQAAACYYPEGLGEGAGTTSATREESTS